MAKGDIIRITDISPVIQGIWKVPKGCCFKVRQEVNGSVYILAKRLFKSNATTEKDLILIKPNEFTYLNQQT